MDFEAILSNPGLSHLATEIFLMVDVKTFGRIKQVCKSWKRHFVDNNLWRKRLLKWAKPGSVAHEIVTEALEKSMDGEELSGLCRALCLNRPWFDTTDIQLVPDYLEERKIDAFARIIEEKSGKARNIMETLKRHEAERQEVDPTVDVSCIDTLGDRVAWGDDGGAVCVRDGAAMGPVLRGFTRSPVIWIGFDPAEDNGGTVVASAHLNRTVNVWAAAGDGLKLLHTLGKKRYKVDESNVFSVVDISGKHLVTGDGGKFIVYAKDQEKRSFTEAFTSDVGARVLCAILLKSEQDLAITGDCKPSLKVWDLKRGQLLHEFGNMGHYRPTSLSQCQGTGLLVVGLSRMLTNPHPTEDDSDDSDDDHEDVRFCGVALLPLPGILGGLALGAFADAAFAAVASPAATVVAASPTRIHAVLADVNYPHYCEHLAFTAGEVADEAAQCGLQKKAIRFS